MNARVHLGAGRPPPVSNSPSPATKRSEAKPDRRSSVSQEEESGSLTRTDWRNTILAGLANYIDAGSIVAGAAGVGVGWEECGPRVGGGVEGVRPRLGGGRHDRGVQFERDLGRCRRADRRLAV